MKPPKSLQAPIAHLYGTYRKMHNIQKHNNIHKHQIPFNILYVLLLSLFYTAASNFAFLFIPLVPFSNRSLQFVFLTRQSLCIWSRFLLSNNYADGGPLPPQEYRQVFHCTASALTPCPFTIVDTGASFTGHRLFIWALYVLKRLLGHHRPHVPPFTLIFRPPLSTVNHCFSRHNGKIDSLK